MIASLLLALTLAVGAGSDRPNVLWITCEDLSPHLGCMGDPLARTPVLDALSGRSTLYTRAFATSGVCAPARSCLITGRYPSSLGSQFMRCTSRLPPGMRFFTHALRDAGYHCTNRSKKDYNLVEPPGAWDASSGKAHWRDRPEGAPFFSVFNHTGTHESQIRATPQQHARRTAGLSASQRQDPAAIQVPPYHPDTPMVRRDHARLYELGSVMDTWVGEVLAQLEEDGLVEDTIVFFFSDHGDGLPRAKRWLYDSGIHVPLIVHVPERFRSLAGAAPGARSERLVSFVDFGPTVLSLCGVPVPDTMQGRAFLGPADPGPRDCVFALRDRMDERIDLVRGVRDARYKYLRNGRPELTRGQVLEYMEQMPTMQELRRLAAAGTLQGDADFFLRPGKPPEELYDLGTDPHEVHDLSGDPAHAEALARMRARLREWEEGTLDLGAFPEARLRALTQTTTAWEFARGHRALVLRVQAAARESSSEAPDPGRLRVFLEDEEPAIRVWGLRGLRVLGAAERASWSPAVDRLLVDPDPSVRVAAAERIAAWGGVQRALPVLGAALECEQEWVRLEAAIAIDHLDSAAESLRPLLQDRKEDPNGYVVRVVVQALRELGEGP